MSDTITMRLELVQVPVSDVDRAKAFYVDRLGFHADHDHQVSDELRFVQLTPPGSACSIALGTGLTQMAPGSVQGLQLVVADIEAAQADLSGRGVDVGEVFHGGDAHAGPDEPYLFGRRRVSGPDPAHGSYRSFASFKDPDGNGWLFQEVTARLPGRVEADTTFASSGELAAALWRAALAHGEHEKKIGKHDDNWPAWYADYMVREQAGEELPS
jgi:catechol 2,3-dioxygenase-like lactoylglutathione lyase family enzyme